MCRLTLAVDEATTPDSSLSALSWDRSTTFRTHSHHNRVVGTIKKAHEKDPPVTVCDRRVRCLRLGSVWEGALPRSAWFSGALRQRPGLRATGFRSAAGVTLVDIPVSRLRPPYLTTQYLARTAITLAANTGFADGTYTGPAVDVYYGLVQIQAIVQGGQPVAIRVLQYPSDRSTSVYINRQALPMLRDEVISAQTANVDIISGATLTSEGFIFSLGAALKQASS